MCSRNLDFVPVSQSKQKINRNQLHALEGLAIDEQDPNGRLVLSCTGDYREKAEALAALTDGAKPFLRRLGHGSAAALHIRFTGKLDKFIDSKYLHPAEGSADNKAPLIVGERLRVLFKVTPYTFNAGDKKIEGIRFTITSVRVV
jgi:hypothetical protein